MLTRLRIQEFIKYFFILDELIRQITLSQPERGLLLLRVRDELRMTLSAYQDLFVSSRDYDPYKNVLRESFSHQTEMETKQDGLDEVIKTLQDERDNLVRILECEEQVFKEQREAAFKKHSEKFHFLKRVNNVLKVSIRLHFSYKSLQIFSHIYLIRRDNCAIPNLI